MQNDYVESLRFAALELVWTVRLLLDGMDESSNMNEGQITVLVDAMHKLEGLARNGAQTQAEPPAKKRGRPRKQAESAAERDEGRDVAVG